MRIVLTLGYWSPAPRLPINYQYPISSWLYQVLDRSDTAFAHWLHEEGYAFAGRRFRFFCFGDLDVRPFRREGDRLQLLGRQVKLTVSFALPTGAQHFLQGLFAEQELRLADRRSGVDFRIDSVEMLPEPSFSAPSIRLRTASPVVVSRPNERGHADYLHPSEPDYAERLYENLMAKIHALIVAEGGIPEPYLPYKSAAFDLRLLSEPRSRLVTIAADTPRETQVRGYHYDFELTCDPAWQQVIWQVGWGEKGSQGFGLVNCLD